MRLGIGAPECFQYSVGEQGLGAIGGGRVGSTPVHAVLGHYLHTDDGRYVANGAFASDASTLDETFKLLEADVRLSRCPRGRRASLDARPPGKRTYRRYEGLLLTFAGGLLSLDDAVAQVAETKAALWRERSARGSTWYPLTALWCVDYAEEVRTVLEGVFAQSLAQIGAPGEDLDRMIEDRGHGIGRAVWRDIENAAMATFKDRQVDGTAAPGPLAQLLDRSAKVAELKKDFGLRIFTEGAGIFALEAMVDDLDGRPELAPRVYGMLRSIDVVAPAIPFDRFRKMVLQLRRNFARFPSRPIRLHLPSDEDEARLGVPPYGGSYFDLVERTFMPREGQPLRPRATGARRKEIGERWKDWDVDGAVELKAIGWPTKIVGHRPVGDVASGKAPESERIELEQKKAANGGRDHPARAHLPFRRLGTDRRRPRIRSERSATCQQRGSQTWVRNSTKKLTLEQLNDKIRDLDTPEEEFAQYFQLDPNTENPMDPKLKLNPDAVDVPPPSDREAKARSAALLNNLNWLARTRRQARYHRMISTGYKGPLIVSEGDSWFQYPFLLKDVIDYLMDELAVFSLGAAGDTLQDMAANPEYLDALEDTGASIFLLSGGGNDAVAGGNLAQHLRDFDPDLSAEGHLLASFDGLLDGAMSHVEGIVRDIGRAFPDVQVLCHGYDYSLPAGGKWLGKPMAKRGITDRAFQAEIARVMIDRLNNRMLALSRQNLRLHYLNCRAAVGKTEWHDELHPTNAGYKKVSKLFRAKITELAPTAREVSHATRSGPAARSAEVAETADRPAPRRRARRATQPAAALAKGRSLHVGVNFVDPEHYGSKMELAACVYDAEDMAEIARDVGFTTKLLLNEKATIAAVTKEIEAAAKATRPGDIFLFTYSGHGGMVTDFNNDEEDGVDETLCLFDSQLIDDELYVLWSQFAADSRVLVLADSCHSGSVARNQALAVETADDPGPADTPKAMPRAQAARIMRKHGAEYEKRAAKAAKLWKGAATREMALPLAASVRLISGCQDNQFSYDGLVNGAFTGALRKIWGNGAFGGDYDAFHRAIRDLLPSRQTPNHMKLGQPSPAYDAQRPFDI